MPFAWRIFKEGDVYFIKYMKLSQFNKIVSNTLGGDNVIEIEIKLLINSYLHNFLHFYLIS